MASNGFINFNTATAEYSMSEVQATFFAQKSHPNHSSMGDILIVMASCDMRGRLMEHFKNGGGYTYKEVCSERLKHITVTPAAAGHYFISNSEQRHNSKLFIMHIWYADFAVSTGVCNSSDNGPTMFQMPPDAVLGCRIFFGPVYQGLLPTFVAKLENGESSFDFRIHHGVLTYIHN